ncbi:unnamed protein product [Tetraodon nigroviridis]|uniref:(spotted green pufferfish) hypothetical protein n=1 Tax=Tetraodon nigroviridis TaxID=99883 RepID=Q4THK1_TETNG|nr:unnamed protein product [Tetraodon nigroviridis]
MDTVDLLWVNAGGWGCPDAGWRRQRRQGRDGAAPADAGPLVGCEAAPLTFDPSVT